MRGRPLGLLPGLGDRQAGTERLGGGDVAGPRVDRVGDSVQDRSPLRRPPCQATARSPARPAPPAPPG